MGEVPLYIGAGAVAPSTMSPGIRTCRPDTGMGGTHAGGQQPDRLLLRGHRGTTACSASQLPGLPHAPSLYVLQAGMVPAHCLAAQLAPTSLTVCTTALPALMLYW